MPPAPPVVPLPKLAKPATELKVLQSAAATEVWLDELELTDTLLCACEDDEELTGATLEALDVNELDVAELDANGAELALLATELLDCILLATELLVTTLLAIELLEGAMLATLDATTLLARLDATVLLEDAGVKLLDELLAPPEEPPPPPQADIAPAIAKVKIILEKCMVDTLRLFSI